MNTFKWTLPIFWSLEIWFAAAEWVEQNVGDNTKNLILCVGAPIAFLLMPFGALLQLAMIVLYIPYLIIASMVEIGLAIVPDKYKRS